MEYLNFKMEEKKSHWENIYQTRKLTEVSWYQPKPEVSLDYIAELNLNKNARIIDVGGGDSFLVDFLLAEGYTDITVLDISEKALERAKERLGDQAKKVTWIVADVSHFSLNNTYDLWHDRAAFHFLTGEDQIKNYLRTLEKSVAIKGTVILGAFSKKGPEKCSGLPIKQYAVEDMKNLFSSRFNRIACENLDHTTPSGAVQNFTFCRFQKIE